MVVRHYKALKLTTLQTQSSIKPFQANEQELNILRLLYNQDKLTTEQIAQSLSFEIQTANFYLEELKVNNMTSHNFTRGKHDVPFMSWSIKQEGRRCLIEIKKTS